MKDYRQTEAGRGAARWEAREAWCDFLFLFAQASGVIWLVRHVPFLRLKQWAQDREDGLIPLPERARDEREQARAERLVELAAEREMVQAQTPVVNVQEEAE
jgi:hypothetical protein